MFALAQNRQAPRFLLRCSKTGVPYWCVAITASISALTYLSAGSTGSSKAFEWFQNLTTISTLFTWVSICIAYIKFHKALLAQGVDRNTLTFKSPFQPYLAWTSLIFFSLIILFQGFDSIAGGFNTNNFITDYIGVPIYFLLYIFWKVYKRTKWRNSAEADIRTGKEALDAVVWPERFPRNWVERVWFWIA